MSLELTVELTRGGDTSNRDKQRMKIEADDLDELDEKVEAVRERMESWAAGFRQIQPDVRGRLDEDQGRLGDVEA